MRAGAAFKGIAVAVANLLVITIGWGVAEHDAAVTFVALAYGVVPTAVLGGWFGHVASLSTRSWYVRVLLALAAVAWPAVGLVASGVRVVCVPTLIAALVLERWTRRVGPSPVPVATARSRRT